MLTHFLTRRIAQQPAVISNITNKVGVHTASVRYPRIQEHNSIFVLCAGSTSTIAAIVAKNSSVSGNTNRSASQIPVITVIMGAEIDGLTIPLGIDFKLVAISQRKAIIKASSPGREFVVIKNVSGEFVCTAPGTANLCPVTVSSGFINLTSLEPFSHLVVHVLSDVLVVAVKTRNPLVIRGNGNAVSGARRERV